MTPHNNPASLPTCPISGPSHRVVFAFSLHGYSLYRCRTCGHLWVHPLPTEEELAAFYDRAYFTGDPSKRGYKNYEEDKKSVEEEFVFFLDTLERATAGRELLDIGTATGIFLQSAAARGWAVHGLEISAYAAEEAQKKGLDVRRGVFEQHAQAFQGMPVITLWDVVEHLRDPRQVFMQMAETLPVGGVIMFATPQADSFFARVLGKWWTLLAPPQHLHYFSLASMDQLLMDVGFERVSITWRGKLFDAGYIIHFVMGWWGISWSWLRRLAAWSFMRRIRLRINPRDMMIILARKR